jgi:hypothetical protein
VRRRVLLALVMALACRPTPPSTPAPVADPAPAPGAPGDTIPAPVPPPSDGRVRFGPSALRYVVHQRVQMEHDRPDLPPMTVLGWRTYVAATVTGPADSAGYPTYFTVDSIVPDSGLILPPTMDPSGARGLRFMGHLKPIGEFVAARVSDSAAAEKVSALVGRFRHFYPRIPPGGIAVGDSWTDTLTLTDSTPARVTRRTTVRHVRASGWEELPEGRAIRLEITEQYETTDAGNAGGQPFDARGNGIGSAVERIGAAGRYLGSVARDSANLVISLPAQGITIPRRQITTTTVTVLP